MVYVILIFLGFLVGCTDYVAQSEDLLEENAEKIEISVDSLKTLLAKVDVEGTLAFRYKDSLLGGDLEELLINVSEVNALSEFPLYLWAFNNSGWNLIDSLSWDEPKAYNFESPMNHPENPYTEFSIALNKKLTPTYVIAEFKPDSLWYEDIYRINTLAGLKYTSHEEMGLFSAFTQNMNNAKTHIELALEGSHETHLKHVYHFLSGIKETNKTWWATAPMTMADSVGVIEQLDIFIETLTRLRQQEELRDQKKIAAQEIQVVLTAFRSSIFTFLDQIGDLVEADEADIVDPLNQILKQWDAFTNGKDDWAGFKNWYETSGKLLVFNL